MNNNSDSQKTTSKRGQLQREWSESLRTQRGITIAILDTVLNLKVCLSVFMYCTYFLYADDPANDTFCLYSFTYLLGCFVLYSSISYTSYYLWRRRHHRNSTFVLLWRQALLFLGSYDTEITFSSIPSYNIDSNSLFHILPDGISGGKCLDPGIQGSKRGKKCVRRGGGVSYPSQALPTLSPQKSSSGDQKQRRKCVLKVFPTRSRRGRVACLCPYTMLGR